MWRRIHDDEANTDEASARSLLRAEKPQWAALAMSYLDSSGTDNAMWRLHRPDQSDLLLRLPRTEGAAHGLAIESEILPVLRDTYGLSVPNLCYIGTPTADFPYVWAVLEWLPGSDAWAERDDLLHADGEALARDLATEISVLSTVKGLNVAVRAAGDRGGPLPALLDRLDAWLDDPVWNAARYMNIDAIRRSAAQSREVAGQPAAASFLHGDLIPGNILVINRRLSALIDWGGAGIGDPAQDFGPAWAILNGTARRTFREVLEIDEPTWLRARAFELEHAVGGVLYYTPKRHPLADVMARTLERILDGT